MLEMLTSLVTLILVFLQFLVVMYVLYLLTKISDSLDVIAKAFVGLCEHLQTSKPGTGERREPHAVEPNDIRTGEVPFRP